MKEALETLKQWVREAKRIVFFGGAGVSTETVRLHRINRKVLLGEDQGKIEAIEGN